VTRTDKGVCMCVCVYVSLMRVWERIFYGALCCSELHFVAVRRSVSQCVAAYDSFTCGTGLAHCVT